MVIIKSVTLEKMSDKSQSQLKKNKSYIKRKSQRKSTKVKPKNSGNKTSAIGATSFFDHSWKIG